MNKIVYGPIQKYRLDIAKPSKIANEMVNYMENFSDSIDLDISKFTQSSKLQKNKQAVRVLFEAVAQLPAKYLSNSVVDKGASEKVSALVRSFRADKNFMKGLSDITEDYCTDRCYDNSSTLFCHDILDKLLQKIFQLNELT